MSLVFYTVKGLECSESDAVFALKQHLPSRVDTDNNMTLHVAKRPHRYMQKAVRGQVLGDQLNIVLSDRKELKITITVIITIITNTITVITIFITIVTIIIIVITNLIIIISPSIIIAVVITTTITTITTTITTIITLANIY
ncbi:hypothetical protein Cadr_000025732 [Camelus dromedarius]|uniref:Uncharacterized protein n=1 Tax=Camelus dromedarius TaxID=9838 RepID=A0A5N4CLV2_CAMDR|nr:hypothetical protein Cadr_000025732 [Camelus dromedarius]